MTAVASVVGGILSIIFVIEYQMCTLFSVDDCQSDIVGVAYDYNEGQEEHSNKSYARCDL